MRPTPRRTPCRPLFATQEEYDAFRARHNASTTRQRRTSALRAAPPIWASTPAPPPPSWRSSPQTADCSTPTTHSNLGNPVAIVLEQLKEIYRAVRRPDPASRGSGRHRLRRGPDQKRLLLRPGPGGDGGPLQRRRATSTPMWTSSSTSAART